MVTNDKIISLIEQLEDQLKQKLKSITLDRSEIQRLLNSLIQQQQPRVFTGDSTPLLETLTRIKGANNQKDVINILIHEISTRCRGCGLVLLASGAQSMWVGPGFGLAKGQQAGSETISCSISEDSLIRKAAATGEVILAKPPFTRSESGIYASLKVPAPDQLALVPMSINGRVQAVVFADETRGPVQDPAALAVMTGVAGTVIEHLPFREKVGYSRFPQYRSSVSGEAAEFAQPRTTEPFPAADEKPAKEAAKPAEPAMEPQEEVAKKPSVEEPVITGHVEGEDTLDSYSQELEMQIGDLADEKTDIEIEVTSAAPVETEETSEEIIESKTPAEAPAEPEPEATPPEEEHEFELLDVDSASEPVVQQHTGLELSETETPEVKTPEEPVQEAEEATIEFGQPETEQEEVVEEPAPAAAPAAKDVTYDALGLSSYDLDRFEGEERKQHEKAIRFARLLVSEIKLYNEEAVKEGRQKKDLASRLRDDITRSRSLYEQRIPEEIRSTTDYFDNELLRQLANGDESLMGE